METTEAGFTAKDVMALRRKTGLGMMDCKKALTATGGDMAAAEEWLRQKLKGKMAERTERATAEGRIGIAVEGDQAAIVEIRTETDFTARNDEFVAMVDKLARTALELPEGRIEPTDAMKSSIEEIRIKTGENVNFARGRRISGGTIGRYLHHDGKRAALVQLEGGADPDVLTGLCQHIVAHVPPPLGVSEKDVPAEVVDKVRREAQEEAAGSGKPPEIAEKIVEGKVRKHLQQNTLLEQMYVRDASGKTPVKKVLPQGTTVTGFVRYTVGQED